jgi:nucleotide-binding universal stress UspA family protein
MTEIIVGVDGSASSGSALTWAVREGGLRGLPVTALLAWGIFDQHHVHRSQHFSAVYSDVDAQQALRAYIARALPPEEVTHVQRRVVNDIPSRALLDAAGEAALLVVGSRGRGGFAGMLLGSVSQHCLHHAPCPVAVIRGDGRPSGRREQELIVVGVDGSEDARRALQWAIAEGRARGARVQALHAWHMPLVDAYAISATAYDPNALEEAGRQTLARALAEVDATGLPEPPEQVLAEGSPAKALLECADDADLIVVGSRGAGGFDRLVLGSVSSQVAVHAAVPVVIVSPKGDVER